MVRFRPPAASTYSPVAEILATDGIAATAPLYAPDTVAELNAAMNDLFAAQEAKPRAYATVDDMVRLGLIETILGGNMRRLLLSIAPDPVLYHCHVYEVAANQTTPHIFGETMSGWHRDTDSEYFSTYASHVSVFVYLTDVESSSGPFEFLPSPPTGWIGSRTPAISVTGPAGSSFAWNRAYFHRAAPNRSPTRRRLLKLSIQPNAFPSAHLGNENFRNALAAVPAGDPYLDVLFGRYQGSVAPKLNATIDLQAQRMPPTGTIGIADRILSEAQARAKLREARRWLREKIAGASKETVAYD